MAKMYHTPTAKIQVADIPTAVTFGTIPAGVNKDHVYYVDANTGDDGNSGLDWDNAFATIDKAVDTHNATINWSSTPMLWGCIFIAPGVYAEAPSIPFYCYMIGTGVQGTDSAAEIHPTTGSCMTGTMLSTVLWNIWFEVNTAVDCLNIGICNNSEIGWCTFTNGAAVAGNGLVTENCTHLHFHHNAVETGQTTGMAYGIQFGGGSNKYAHCCNIHDNRIHAETACIEFAASCTDSGTHVYRNHLICSTAAGTLAGVGINNLGDGNAFCTENFIAATDAIVHGNSTLRCVGNHVSNNGTGAMEVSGS